MSDYNEHLISMAGGDGNYKHFDGDDCAAIEARANAATEGPWYVDDAEQTVRAREYAGEIVYDRSAEHSSEWADFKPTAEFIAHARTDIPALLAMAREQRAVIAKVAEVIRDLSFDYDVDTPTVVDVEAIRAVLTATDAS